MTQAERKVEAAQKYLFVVVGTCSNHGEALAQALKLRNRGIMVTVTSLPVDPSKDEADTSSAPAEGRSRQTPKRRHSTYNELFQNSLKGTVYATMSRRRRAPGML